MSKIVREIIQDYIFSKSATHYTLAHLHETFEMTYVKTGELKIYVDGKLYEMHHGDFVLMFPNQVHNYFCEYHPENEFYTINISAEAVGKYYSNFQNKVPTTAVCTPENSALGELIEVAHKIRLEGTTGYVVDALVTAIFGKLLEYYTLVPNTVPHDRISRILIYCNEHYKEDDITGEKISKELHISRPHISNIFNKKLGITLRDYINSLRITDAVNAINSEHISIAQAALLSGFSTIRTFNRAFKNIYGVTPSEYISTNKTPQE